MPSNNVLHSFFILSTQNPYNARVMIACGLPRVPDRRTFDRRLRNVSSDGSDEDLRPRINAMGQLFIAEKKLVAPFKTAADPARAYFVIASTAAAARPEVKDFIEWLKAEAAKR